MPALIADAGDKAGEHFLEFFAATIRNKNTRMAYVQAVAQFCRWCELGGLRLTTIRPLHEAGLRGVARLFNSLVIEQVVPENPAVFVKGPRFSRQVGITPILEAEQMRALLDSIKAKKMVKIPKKHSGIFLLREETRLRHTQRRRKSVHPGGGGGRREAGLPKRLQRHYGIDGSCGAVNPGRRRLLAGI